MGFLDYLQYRAVQNAGTEVLIIQGSLLITTVTECVVKLAEKQSYCNAVPYLCGEDSI